jgi:catechol 2,3-dioxygenase-like lactoylglutathione lyase family enzyme
MPRYNGINHLALATGDMDTTIRFYRDLLGMRLVAGLGAKGFRHYFFEISPTDLIAFFEWPAVEKIPVKDHGVPVKGPCAFDHLSIGVENSQDLIAIKKTLSAAGFWVSEIMDHGFIHSVYSFDPNHIAIEFSWAVPSVDIRSHPKMMDKNPSAITCEGAEPNPDRWIIPDNYNETEEDFNIYPGEGKVFADHQSFISAENSKFEKASK